MNYLDFSKGYDVIIKMYIYLKIWEQGDEAHQLLLKTDYLLAQDHCWWCLGN